MGTGRKLVAGNWKMNLLEADAIALARATAQAAAEYETVDVAIAPPAILLDRVARAVTGSPLAIWGQTCSEHASGAFTGETSIAMLRDAGADGTLLGHSERRHAFGESDEQVAAKVRAAASAGLPFTLCVGETLEEREAGQTAAVVERQLRTGLEGVGHELLTIAYEPVWAIGTGKTASPAQAQEVHATIRRWLGERFGGLVAPSIRVLYGGSVKGDNAAELMGQPDIDGVLVGGASLKADEFTRIIAGGA